MKNLLILFRNLLWIKVWYLKWIKFGMFLHIKNGSNFDQDLKSECWVKYYFSNPCDVSFLIYCMIEIYYLISECNLILIMIWYHSFDIKIGSRLISFWNQNVTILVQMIWIRLFSHNEIWLDFHSQNEIYMASKAYTFLKSLCEINCVNQIWTVLEISYGTKLFKIMKSWLFLLLG